MNKKQLKKIALFSIVFLLFVTADILLKHHYFEYPGKDATGPITHDFTVIGIRSNAHYGTTILDSIGISISRTWSVVVFVISGLIFIALFFISKNKFTTIFVGIALAGIIGNGTNIVFDGYVKNIFFMPWHDSGTFNFADVLVVVGAPLTAIGILITAFKK